MLNDLGPSSTGHATRRSSSTTRSGGIIFEHGVIPTEATPYTQNCLFTESNANQHRDSAKNEVRVQERWQVAVLHRSVSVTRPRVVGGYSALAAKCLKSVIKATRMIFYQT